MAAMLFVIGNWVTPSHFDMVWFFTHAPPRQETSLRIMMAWDVQTNGQVRGCSWR
jgi:hypothetical protein